MFTKRVVWGALIAFYIVEFVLVVAVLFSANFWVTEGGIKASFQNQNHNVSDILSIDRNFIDYSVVSVMENGKERKYLVDASLLGLYNFISLSKE